MAKRDSKVERLLRSAGKAEDKAGAEEMPFGFDTRVLAHWRAQDSRDPGEAWRLMRIVRRIALSAAIVTVVASSAACWQLAQSEEWDEPSASGYAIADTAIEAGAFQ